VVFRGRRQLHRPRVLDLGPGQIQGGEYGAGVEQRRERRRALLPARVVPEAQTRQRLVAQQPAEHISGGEAVEALRAVAEAVVAVRGEIEVHQTAVLSERRPQFRARALHVQVAEGVEGEGCEGTRLPQGAEERLERLLAGEAARPGEGEQDDPIARRTSGIVLP
jgi:hypothetical protein